MGKIATALTTGVLPRRKLPTMDDDDEMDAYERAVDEAMAADLDGENDDTVILLDAEAEKKAPKPVQLLTTKEAWRQRRDQELKDEGRSRKSRRETLRKEARAKPWQTG